MATPLRLSWKVSLALAGAWLALLVVSDEAEASHFRQADVNWANVGSAGFTTNVEFHGHTYWRLSAVGGLISCTTPGAGGICGPIGTLDFGDFTPGVPAYYLAETPNVAGGYVGGELVDSTGAYIQHAYPAFGGPYFATLSDCCRIGTTTVYDHVNNGNANWQVDFTVDLADTASPVIGMPVGVDCVINTVCTFPVPVTSGGSPTWAMGGPLAQPGPPDAPAAATVGFGTGTYSWNTWGATFNPAVCETVYSTQVHVGAGTGTSTESAVDFLIRLHDNTLPSAPTLAATPINGILPGAHLTWTQPPGGCPGLYYRVYRSYTSIVPLWTFVEVPESATSYTDPFALPCITAYYRVAAVNWAGETSSNTVAVTPNLGIPCPIAPPPLAVDTVPLAPWAGWQDAGEALEPRPSADPPIACAVAEPFDTRQWLPFLDLGVGCTRP